MIRNRPRAVLSAVAISATLAAAISVPGAAQEVATGPEGIDWKLSSYATGGVDTPVPFGITATLLLEGGLASGSGGCNTFSGTYALDGTTLMFGDEISTTLMLCDGQAQVVEDTYLAALPQVAGWAVTDSVLRLSDGLGATILTFEVPGIGLTSSELAGLGASLDALRSDIASLRTEVLRLNVDRLRERVKILEAGAEDLQTQIEALKESSSAGTGGNGFTQAEAILLEGIPARIASRCLPLRSSLPKGTYAAVRCAPDSAAVASVDYHLMEGEDAAAAFQDTMRTFNVPEAVSDTATCEFGVKSQRVWIGNGWQSEGCYRTASRAELRFVDNATACRQLKVGQKRLGSPAIYIALQGSSGDVEGAHAWATRNLTDASTQITSITQPIERPGERVSPSCPT
jgi:heat shock protein HslJ